MSRNRPSSSPPPEGRLALVTGATGGIGAACARALAAAGHRLALTYASRRREAEELAAELGGSAFELDLRRRDEVKTLARRIEDELGTVEVLVHNAGLIRDGLLAFLSDDDWDEVMAVNLHGPFVLTKALLRGMLRQRWGRVVSIASVSGQLGHRGQAHYSAAKAGLIAFTKTLALEVASYNVTANSVAPGFIDTEMLAGLGEERLARFLGRVPLGRLGTAEEVASLVAYLASDEAAFITGQTLRIDGGLLTA